MTGQRGSVPESQWLAAGRKQDRANLHVIAPPDPAADVVAVLEAALAQARAGELSSVAVAKVYRDGRAGYEFSSVPWLAAQIGSVEIMRAKLVGKAKVV